MDIDLSQYVMLLKNPVVAWDDRHFSFSYWFTHHALTNIYGAGDFAKACT